MEEQTQRPMPQDVDEDANRALENAMQDCTHAFLRCCRYLKLIKHTEHYKSRADSLAEYVASV